MRRQDESQKPDEAKKALFSNNCNAIQRKNDKGKKERFEYISFQNT